MQEEIGGMVRPESALRNRKHGDRWVSPRDDDEDAQGRRVDRRRGQQHARLSHVIDQPSLNRHAHSDSHQGEGLDESRVREGARNGPDEEEDRETLGGQGQSPDQ